MRTLRRALPAIVAVAAAMLLPGPASAASSPTPIPPPTTTPTTTPTTAPTTSPAPKTTTRCTPVELLRDGSFEQPRVPRGSTWALFDDARVPGWRTDDPAGRIEIWGRGAEVRATDGRQLAELNEHGGAKSIYQDVRAVPGTRLQWSLMIRARNTGQGPDTDTTSIHFTATPRPNQGGSQGAHGFVYANTVDETYWKKIFGWYDVPRGQTWTRVSIQSDDHTGGDDYGNLIDAASVKAPSC
jgi:hypothetical protein